MVGRWPRRIPSSGGGHGACYTCGAPVSRRSSVPRRCLLAALAAVSLAACAGHDLYSFSFRKAELSIGERGIAIPVPPPSLTDQPVQESDVVVDVDFAIETDADVDLEPEVRLHVRDRVGGAHGVVDLDASGPQTVLVEGLVLDHSRNCLEVWLAADDGSVSQSRRYHTTIEPDDTTVRVDPGCEAGAE